MSTHLLTPQMAGVLERIRRAKRPAFHTLTPAAARAAYEAGAEVLDLPRAQLARVQDLTLPGGDGLPRSARLYADGTEPRPGLLYLHGGGFVIGSLETHDSLCRQIARRSGFAVVALDYRLAPEHRFPAAVDDALAAMGALSHDPAAYGLSARPLAVAGDSAGGTLAAACALHARDLGLPLSMQVLITPGTAARPDSASHHMFGQGFLLDRDGVDWFFDHYIPREQRRDPRFAPLEADVDGVASAFVLLAECDPLVDEGLAYADKLRAAGVPVELDLVRGVTHDFIKMGRAIPQAHAALDAMALALKGALNP